MCRRYYYLLQYSHWAAPQIRRRVAGLALPKRQSCHYYHYACCCHTQRWPANFSELLHITHIINECAYVVQDLSDMPAPRPARRTSSCILALLRSVRPSQNRALNPMRSTPGALNSGDRLNLNLHPVRSNTGEMGKLFPPVGSSYFAYLSGVVRSRLHYFQATHGYILYKIIGYDPKPRRTLA